MEGREVFSILQDISAAERKLGMETTLWATKAAAICRQMGDALHLVMVGRSNFPHYVEYMADPLIADSGGVFIRDVNARSRKRGYSPILHHYLERCEFIADGGRCALFHLLTLVDDTDYYIEACHASIARIGRSSLATERYIGRGGSLLCNLDCPNCILNIQNYELRPWRAGEAPPRYGKYIAIPNLDRDGDTPPSESRLFRGRFNGSRIPLRGNDASRRYI